MIAPTCFVRVNGQRLDATTSPAVYSELSVPWGREDSLAQPDPATAAVGLWDATGSYAVKVDTRSTGDLVGLDIDVGWTHAGTDHVLFRGRIVTVSVEPHTRGGVRGHRIMLEAASRVAELANWTPPARAEESINARAGALATHLSTYFGGVFDAVTVPGRVAILAGETDNHYRSTVRPIPADASLLEALVALYDATVSKLSYLPDERVIRGVERRQYPAARGLAGLVRDTDPAISNRAGKGAYIAAAVTAGTLRNQQNPATPGENVRGWWLDGHHTGRPSESWITRRSDQRVTDLEVTYRLGSAAAGYSDGKLTQPLTRRTPASSLAKRTATVEVETLGTGALISDVNALVADYAGQLISEGAAWIPAPVLVDTRITDGFETLPQALELLAGGETSSLVFLQRTDYPGLGVRPIFGVMGGTIAHVAGEWLLEVRLAPVFTDQPQHAIAWDEVDDGTPGNTLYVYADGTLNAADGLHESVTAEDLMYCSTGLGVTTVPADTGWDTYR